MQTGWSYNGEFIPLSAVRGTFPVLGVTVWTGSDGRERSAKTSDLIPVYQETVQTSQTAPQAVPGYQTASPTLIGPTGAVTFTDGAPPAPSSGGMTETALLPGESAYSREYAEEGAPEATGAAGPDLMTWLLIAAGAFLLLGRKR